MANIINIVDPCTLKLSEKWQWGRYSGRKVRLAGVYPPSSERHTMEVCRQMYQLLLRRQIRITNPFYVETGPTLVAEVEIQGIDISQIFAERYAPEPPRSRLLDPADRREIAMVGGRFPSQWHNPLRRLPLDQCPALCNFPFPTDPWLLGYAHEMQRVNQVFCEDRMATNADNECLKRFFELRNERELILFGDCGSGKTWFLLQYLAVRPPPNMDVGIIDVSAFPPGPSFEKRLHHRLDQILTKYVDSRPGGLFQAIGSFLRQKAQGVFPDRPLEDPYVMAWCHQYIKDLHKDPVLYNTVRLESYIESERDLLLVIDNLDGFSRKDQNILFDLVVQSVTIARGVFVIIPLRTSSEFFSQRLNTKLQRLLRGHHLSPLNMRQAVMRRFCVSESGHALQAAAVDGKRTLLDIYNLYLNSPAAALIGDLAGSDMRQYVRLYRRLLYSDELDGFGNIAKDYYAITALMLKPDEPFDEDASFIVNVFDNGHPDEIGNALIRWRVIEYFLRGNRKTKGAAFRYYFQRLGYDLKRVEEVIRLWVGAGAIERADPQSMDECQPTRCAERYSQLLPSLWYCIVIKSSMYIDRTYILQREDAKTAAAKYGVRLPSGVEWVSDEGFLAYLADEEELEEFRISNFPNKSKQLEKKLRAIGPRSIHRELWYEYAFQQRAWQAMRPDRRHARTKGR